MPMGPPYYFYARDKVAPNLCCTTIMAENFQPASI